MGCCRHSSFKILAGDYCSCSLGSPGRNTESSDKACIGGKFRCNGGCCGSSKHDAINGDTSFDCSLNSQIYCGVGGQGGRISSSGTGCEYSVHLCRSRHCGGNWGGPKTA